MTDTAARTAFPTAAQIQAGYYANAAGDDYDETRDADPRPQIRCGHCRETHHAAEMVRACAAGATVAQCNEFVKVWTEDGPHAVPCGEDAAYTDTGFTCTAGHSYVSTETRLAQGWDYADDAYDAGVILAGGRDYRPGGPNTVIDGAEAARVAGNVLRTGRP